MTSLIQDIFNNYDYGYNLNFVSAEDWQKEDQRYYRIVYLEQNDKFSTPIQACFNIYMHVDGRIKSVMVDILNS